VRKAFGCLGMDSRDGLSWAKVARVPWVEKNLCERGRKVGINPHRKWGQFARPARRSTALVVKKDSSGRSLGKKRDDRGRGMGDSPGGRPKRMKGGQVFFVADTSRGTGSFPLKEERVYKAFQGSP